MRARGKQFATERSKIMAERNQKTIALNVQLRGNNHTAQPGLANYTTVGLAQGLVYVDFGFIEPAMLAAVAKAEANGGTAPKAVEGRVTTRVAMPLESLLRLQQQVQQVVGGLRARSKATGAAGPQAGEAK
jgi:hypothetical protein